MRPIHLALILLIVSASLVKAQTTQATLIPLPPTTSPLGSMPGVDELPDQPELPPVLLKDGAGHPMKPIQWFPRRKQMQRILEYYATGSAPPPPENLTRRVLGSDPILDGRGVYHLVEIAFAAHGEKEMHVGEYLPTTDGRPLPAIIMIGGPVPGEPTWKHLPHGATQGTSGDALSVVGPASKPATAPSTRSTGRSAAEIAAQNPALAHGYAYLQFDYNECGEDTTLRNPDGSWAYRNTRFAAAYPEYDWGLLRIWAWGASRVVDSFRADPAIDTSKLIITGVSRAGKAALIAGAFDERFSVVAPDSSSGGGTPAYRFSGVEHGGREGLTEMTTKYPNWFSPQLRQFRGHAEKLPFDQHWFIALCAPRAFIALEGTHDLNVNQEGVRQSYLAAKPVYDLLSVPDKIGVSWTDRPHGMTQGDWDALFAMSDHFLLGQPTSRSFDHFPTTSR